MSAVYHPYPCVHCSGREIANHPLFITPYVRCLSPLIKLAVHQPYVRCLPPLPMCPQFRKGDCQPFTLQKLTTGYKPITSSLQAAGLVTPQQACYKGLVMLYELASFVTKLVTKLVTHYEYIARNEARYEARNAPVWRCHRKATSPNHALGRQPSRTRAVRGAWPVGRAHAA